MLGGAWLVTRFTRAELNDELAWRDIVGVAVLAGVGFTVALLVADLSFDGARGRGGEDRRARSGSVVAALLAAVAPAAAQPPPHAR